jgi:excinuclease ABC subunit C
MYVGKAKNLKRVSSYFNKIHDTAKTNVLVKKIVTIKHIVVPTETDALLLESNLIKTLQQGIMYCCVMKKLSLALH